MDSTPCCKLGRLAQVYDFDELNAELERKWTGDGSESTSLRELQRTVNRRLVAKKLIEHGLPPIDGEAENIRRVLTDSDVSEGRRIDARRRLEGEGIDVEELLDDFVSHQTVYNHLRNCRDVELSGKESDQDRLDQIPSRIFRLQKRTEVVTEDSLSQLESDDLLAPDSFDVIVDIQAVCEECGRSSDVESLFERGGCVCQLD